jgi:hypothetical protein
MTGTAEIVEVAGVARCGMGRGGRADRGSGDCRTRPERQCALVPRPTARTHAIEASTGVEEIR